MNVEPPRIIGHQKLARRDEVSLYDDAEYVVVRVANADYAGQDAECVLLDRVIVQAGNLSATRLGAPRLSDVRFEDCDFASAQWERAIFHRTEFLRCRLTGFVALESHLQNVSVRHCSAKFVHFRFGKLRSVQFEDCDLEEADFQGTDLSGIRFIRCNLRNAQLSHTKLKGTDFRSSELDGIRVGIHELPGAIVDHFQAAYLAGLLGVEIKSEHDD